MLLLKCIFYSPTCMSRLYMEVEENQKCTRSSELSKESLDFLEKICHRMAPHRKPSHQILLLEHHPHTSYKICVHLRKKRRERNNTSEKMKYICLNCGEWYEDMIDHGSYAHNLSSCEIKAWKNFSPEQDSDPWLLWYRCISWVHNYDDQTYLHTIPCSSNIWAFIYSLAISEAVQKIWTASKIRCVFRNE